MTTAIEYVLNRQTLFLYFEYLVTKLFHC